METIIQVELDQARVEADAAYALIDIAFANEQVLRKEVEEMQQKLDSQQRLIDKMGVLSLKNGAASGGSEDMNQLNLQLETIGHDNHSSSLDDLVSMYKKSNQELEIRCRVYENEIKRMYEIIQTLTVQSKLTEENGLALVTETDSLRGKDNYVDQSTAEIILDDKENIETVMKNVAMKSEGKSGIIVQGVKTLPLTNVKSNINDADPFFHQKIVEEATKECPDSWRDGITASLTNSDTGLSFESRDSCSCTERSDLELRMKSIDENLSLRSSYFDSSSSISENDSSSYDSEDSESDSGSSSDESSDSNCTHDSLVSTSTGESSVSSSTVGSSPDAREMSLIDSLSESDEMSAVSSLDNESTK